MKILLLQVLVFGCVVVAISSCGSKTVENLRGPKTGEVAGKFAAKLSTTGISKIEDLKTKLESYGGSGVSKLTKRFKSDDQSLALGNSLDDVYSIDLPDTGSSFLNTQMFKQLQKLTKGNDAYLDAVDTDKHASGDFMTLTETTYNDTKYEDQYYLEMIRWQLAKEDMTAALVDAAAPVLVAVVDTGVDSNHEDLKDVMYQDSEGKAVGYDAFKQKEIVPKDNHIHGTHVAGIVAGTGNNSKGIYGVGYLQRTNGEAVTQILPVTVLDEDGAGTTREISVGLRWAINKYKAIKATAGRSKQKLIVNMSLGGPFETDGYNYSQDSDGKFNDETFKYAADNDVLIFVAAGNESCKIGSSCDVGGKDFTKAYYFPCSYKNVICVAASTHEEELAGFSNRNESVELVAPGWLVESTIPNDKIADSKAYKSLNGTSMATPVAAGAAAALWAIYPDFTAKEIGEIIKKSAAKISKITEETKSNAGRLDLKAAMDYASALSLAGKTPSEMDATTSSEAIKPTNAPKSDADPGATSERVGGDSSTESSCGTIKGLSSGVNFGLLLFMLAAGPLLYATAQFRKNGQI